MRLALTRKTDLAVRALRALAAGEERVAGAVLAREVGTSVDFLAQVMRPLTASGWVESTPGPGGGYRLRVPPEEISLLEVIESEEGPVDDGRCVFPGLNCGPDDPCPLHDAWVKARAAMTSQLASISIMELSGATGTSTDSVPNPSSKED